MSKPRSATISTSDKPKDAGAKEPKTVGLEAKEGADAAADHTAARGPVRGVKGQGPAAQKGGKANKGNRTGREAREAGANDLPGDQKDEDEDKEESEEEAKDKDASFWQHIVTASYRSRKGRGEWGDGEA